MWLSADAIAAWEPAGGGTRGGQRKYSDVAIKTALTLRAPLAPPAPPDRGLPNVIVPVDGTRPAVARSRDGRVLCAQHLDRDPGGQSTQTRGDRSALMWSLLCPAARDQKF